MLSIDNTNTIQHFRRIFDRVFVVRSVFTFIFLLGILAIFSPPIFSQSNVTGGFEGRVTDGVNGPGLADVIVRFINPANGYQSARKTNSDGYFQQDFLSPGIYTIRVEVGGYEIFEKKQELYATRSNRFLPLPIELKKIASVTTTTTPTPLPVTTTTTATTNQDDKAESDTDVGAGLNPRRDGAFNSGAVTSLPLGGTTLTRTFDELAFLVPGVFPAPQAIGNSVGPGIGGGVGTSGQFSVNGLRSRANNFTVDGSDNNDEDIGVRRQGFFTLVPQPIESIQEFQIITLLAPAQYGRNLGAQVNAISKQGGNRFSGSIFGLFSFDQLNARNFFDNASGNYSSALQGRRFVDGVLLPVFLDGQQVNVNYDAGEKDVMSLLQGGFAVGGRLVRNKMFFFVSGEVQRLDGTKETNFAVPTIEQRGLFGTGAQGLFLNDAGGTTPLFPTAVQSDAIFSLFPFANNPNGIYGRNTFTQSLPSDARGIILSGRYDYNFKINDRPQSFTARYNFTDDKRDLTNVGGAIFSAIRPLVRTDNFSSFLSGGLTDNLSNEFRFSWGRTRLNFEEIRDTSFLRPVSGNLQNTPFLLNASYIVNNTIASCPGNITPCPGQNIIFANRVRYDSAGITTQNSRLGLIGQLIIAGFSPVGVDVFNFPQQRENNTFQFADSLRWQVGKHSLTFGTDIRRTYLESVLPRNSRPLVTFNGGFRCLQFTNGTCTNEILANPLDLASAGAPTGFFQSIALSGKDSQINLSYYQLNFFAQDDWRVTKNFTLNFGLRYEYNTPPKEAAGKIESTFNASLPSFLTGLRQFIDGRTSIYDGDRNNFAPRIGFAYSPTSKTVIRGGFGIYYDQILGAVVSQSRNVFPTFSTINFGGGQLADNNGRFSFFNPAYAVFDPANGFVCNRLDTNSPCNLTTSIPLIQPGTLNSFNSVFTAAQLQQILQDIYLNFPRISGVPFGATLPTRKLDTPFSYQYSLGFEQRLFEGTFLSIAYVGTTGRSLLRFTTPNLGENYINSINNFLVNPGCNTNPGLCEPITTGTTDSPARPVSNVGAINQFETTGRSQYHSLQIGLRGQLLNRKLQYQMNYVYGKVLDDVSDVFDLAGAFALPQNSRTFEGEYAAANFDIRHRFTYNFIYDLPSLKNRSEVVEFFFGGWQISGTGKFNTGQPFTVNSIFDVNKDGNLTDRLNNTQFITVTGNNQNPLQLTCTTATQCQSMLAPIGQNGSIPRNSFRAGNVLELDLSFAKAFTFRETQSFQFRVDVFNFINRANFGVPVRFLEAPGFGQATDTITPGRRIQFVLKYSF